MSQVTENKVVAAPVPMTPLQEFWHYFKRNKGAVVGLAYVAVMIIIAVFANFIAPYNPADQFRDALLAGAILTETIFSWPGLGRWLIDALQRRDYPVVQGGVLLVATMIILVNLLVDLLYGVVNPRIRHKT